MDDSKIIDGYENYTISRNGTVMNTYTNKVMKPRLKEHGYYTVGLCKNSKQKGYLVHRLLMLAFIPNPENKKCVDHIDRNKLNNSLSNLRWATVSENARNRDVKKENIYTTNKYNERYISFDKSRNLYMVRINNIRQQVSKRCKTLDEAIEFRNSVL